MSGSTDNSDIAERRKLEAELAEAKEGLNDSYYDHAKDSQNQALDDEASAYEKSMTNYIETLREKLDQAKLNMDLFMEQVTTAVTMNAGIVLDKYTETGIAIDSALTTPWKNAADAMSQYETETLPLMNAWTQPGGTFDIFKTNATDQLTSPWIAAKNAANEFVGSMSAAMSGVYDTIKTNVANSTAELNKIKQEIDKINSTPINPPVTQTPGNRVNTNPSPSGGGAEPSHADIANLQRFLNVVYSANLVEDGIWGKKTEQVLKSVQGRLGLAATGKYNQATRDALIKKVDEMIAAYRKQSGSSMIGQGIARLTGAKNNLPLAFHAKGTLGTKRNEFAITDESWIGEEITLAAGKNGQLQYLKKGSAVLPSEIATNLVKWGKLNPNMMNIGKVGTNFTMISNAINKPEFKLDIENFLRCDNVSQDTLPELKRFVNEQMNSLIKQMNYSLKKSGAR